MARSDASSDRRARLRSSGSSPALDPATRGPAGGGPGLVLVALSEAPRERASDAAPHDGAALEAGSLLARGFRCPVETVHVPPDADRTRRPEDELLHVVDGRENPMLVLGARNRFPAAGRTTRGVITFLPCPVWIQRGPWTAPRRVLAALSDSELDRDVFRLAVEVARGLGARLDLAHCREHAGRGAGSISRDELEGLAEAAHEQGGPSAGALGDVGILEVAGPARVALAPHLERADLTVLGRGIRRGLGNLLHDVVAHRRGPFVVVPPPV